MGDASIGYVSYVEIAPLALLWLIPRWPSRSVLTNQSRPLVPRWLEERSRLLAQIGFSIKGSVQSRRTYTDIPLNGCPSAWRGRPRETSKLFATSALVSPTGLRQ